MREICIDLASTPPSQRRGAAVSIPALVPRRGEHPPPAVLRSRALCLSPGRGEPAALESPPPSHLIHPAAGLLLWDLCPRTGTSRRQDLQHSTEPLHKDGLITPASKSTLPLSNAAWERHLLFKCILADERNGNIKPKHFPFFLM